MENNKREISPLDKDESGAMLLDKETKALLLMALRDGKITQKAIDIIGQKLDFVGTGLLIRFEDEMG